MHITSLPLTSGSSKGKEKKEEGWGWVCGERKEYELFYGERVIYSRN
jgi:hypothetical protein